MNFNLVSIYYKSEIDLFFKVQMSMSDPNDQLDQMNNYLNHCDTRKVVNVEY